MAQTIGSVLIDVKADTQKLVSGFDKAEKTVANVTASMKKSIIGLAGAYASFQGINAFGSLIKGSIDSADSLSKLSEKLAISTEDLSKLKYAAGYADVDLNKLNAAMSAMIRRTNNFKRDGGGAAAKAMNDLGISADFARKNFTDTNTTFKILLDKLGEMPDGMKKTAIAQDLFSKSASDVIRFANMGADEIQRLGDEAERTGNVIGSDFAQSSAALNDSFTALENGFSGITNKLTSYLTPSILEATRAFERLLGVEYELSNFELTQKISEAKVKLEELKNSSSWLNPVTTSEINRAKHTVVYLEAELKARQKLADIKAKPDTNKSSNIINNNGNTSIAKNNTIEKSKTSLINTNIDWGIDWTKRLQDQENFAKKSKEINSRINDEYLRSQMDQYDNQKYTLALKYNEEVKYAQDIDALNSVFTKKLNKIEDEKQKHLDDLEKQGVDVAKKIGDSFETNFADKLTDSLLEGKMNFSDFANSILQDMAKITTKQTFQPLAQIGGDFLTSTIGNLFSFENGGIMSSAGSLPLKKYSNGGIANSPQLALFGEGKMNEAYVPLPDGRTIPVTMNGGGSSNVVLNIENNTSSEITADMISEYTKTDERGEETKVINIVMKNLNTNSSFRSAIAGVR